MLNDLRYSVRSLLKNPAFAAVAIVTLALGIGANTAIFSVVHGVLLRPLPYPRPEQLVQVWSSTANEPRGNQSAADFLDLQRENQSLSGVAGYRGQVFTVGAEGIERQQIEGSYVTVDFFDVLGTRAVLGRTFSRAVDAHAGERLVLLSDAVWQQLFARRPDAAGRRIQIDGQTFTVAGILPPDAGWPEGSGLWLLANTPVPPSPIATGGLTDREVRYFEAIGRLKPGVSLSQAGDDVARLSKRIQERPSPAPERTVRLVPLYEQIVGEVRFGLFVLQAAVGLVLLIACANVSGLLIARGSGRVRELAIRAALGAGRGRLVRQLFTESVLLGATGGLAGLLLASWLTGLLLRVLPESVPRAQQITLDRVVAMTTLLTGLLTSIVFGIVPALQSSRADAATALKQGGDRGSASRARGRSALVVGEIALTLVLLAGAGLLLNSFVRLRNVESGLRPENVTLMELTLPPSRYPTAVTQSALYGRLLALLSERGELQAAGAGFPGPLRGSSASASFYVEGRPAASDKPFAHVGSVSGGFFAAMGIPIIAGRTFTEADRDDAPGVGIASVALARKYWPGEDAVGKHLRFEDDPKAPWMTIVGVVGDVRQLGLDKEAPPILYIPYRQFPLPFANVAVRSTAPSGTVASILRTALAAADPELAAGEITTLQGVLDRSVGQPRFRTSLLTAFAIAALLLSAVGVYGLMSFSVVERRRETAIRIALGAQPRQVLHSMVREGIVLALAGTALGLAGTLMMARLLAAFLFGVRSGDPLTLSLVAGVLLAVATAAAYIPARRALRVDPIAALRAE